MLRTLPVLLLLLSLALAAGATEAGATEQIIPASEFDLDDHAGKVVVVDFWASWCPPCREAMPFLSDMQEKYGDQGLVTVAVNVDQDPKAPRKMIARLNDEIIVVRDPQGHARAGARRAGACRRRWCSIARAMSSRPTSGSTPARRDRGSRSCSACWRPRFRRAEAAGASGRWPRPRAPSRAVAHPGWGGPPFFD